MGRSLLYYLITILFVLPSGIIYSQKKESIKVGVYNNSPKIYVNKEGKPDGIFVAILERIAEEENLELKYVIGEWHELMSMLQEAEIDMLPDLAYSPERDSLFSLNSVPVLTSWLEVFSLKNNTIHTVKNMNGKNIGVLAGSIQEALLKGDFDKSFPMDYNLKSYEDYPRSTEALKSGEIDLLVASRFFSFSEHFDDKIISTGIILRPSELHLAFSKNTDPLLINRFDRQLAAMKNDPRSDYYMILQTHLDPVMKPPQSRHFLWLLAVLFIVLLIVTLFAFLLKYQVDLKTRALWRRNRQLTKAKEKAEENERLKTIFLQNMSHEIRTPMNGIIGFLSLLKEPDLDSASREKYIDIVNKSGKRLLTTINNIIEISKIDTRQIEVRHTNVDLNEVMNFYYNFFIRQAKEKGLELHLTCKLPPGKEHVLTDKFILDNILTNLINNALKFTNEGIVELGVDLKGNFVKFWIKDSGIGIPVERQKAIFERFVQANLNMTRAHEGSGLGLAIVKAYVEILNGKIWLESEEGKGSTFYFEIPYIPAEVEPPEEVEPLQEQFEGEHLKVLVAEDDNISFLFIQQLLNLQEVEVLRATDGRQVIEMARNNPDISLILMDIKMPEINGIEATREIRKFNPSVPIIAQSAYTFSNEQDKAMEAGCNGYITKPINKSDLLKLIKQYTHH
ncbi:response regulator [Salinimicrobium sp. CAU 1759]